MPVTVKFLSSRSGLRAVCSDKEDRALRTETTINNTRDFYIGKSMRNLSELRQTGFQANRRLLQVEQISHDCIRRTSFPKVNHPIQVDTQTGFRSSLC